MCIVVDANAAHHLKPDDLAGAAVLRWLLKGKGRMVVSKALLSELSITKLRSTILQLDRAGKVLRANDEKCVLLEKQLVESGKLESNDAHVVALISISKCDVIFTHDQPLHKDLKNREIVDHDCAIFQTVDHQHLLGECRC